MHLQMDGPARFILHLRECGFIHSSQLLSSEYQDFQYALLLFALVGLH